MGVSCSLCFSVVCGVDNSRTLHTLVPKCGRVFQEMITVHATAIVYKADMK